MNNKNWVGKVVSIQCIESLGVFQGTIKDVNASTLTIVRVFRNGLPVRTLDTGITIKACDIVKLELITALNTDVVTNGNGSSSSGNSYNNNMHKHSNNESALSNKLKDMKINKLAKSPPNTQQQQLAKSHQSATTNNSNSPYNNVMKSFGNMIPAKVEVRLGTSAPNGHYFAGVMTTEHHHHQQQQQRNASKPIDIVQMPMAKNAILSSNTPSTTPFKGAQNEKKADKRNRRNQQAFDTPIDNGIMNSDFDFEKNLALFDKKAIWNEINAVQKPDQARPAAVAKAKNYRHNENVISSKPAGNHQITVNCASNMEFSTDDGLIIPSIPLKIRMMVQAGAEKSGLSWLRMCDMLARGTTEMALMLLGGARRLTPKNQHQWPTIVIICDEPFNERSSEAGIATGRQLASHGLKICLYVATEVKSYRESLELALFQASENCSNTCLVSELPACDLVILAVTGKLSPGMTKWINESRSPTLAIDPPAAGIKDITVKYSILPILPIDGISTTCGKLYLCNLGIPDQYYTEAGIKFKSPFGHKFVIPIHEA